MPDAAAAIFHADAAFFDAIFHATPPPPPPPPSPCFYAADAAIIISPLMLPMTFIIFAISLSFRFLRLYLRRFISFRFL